MAEAPRSLELILSCQVCFEEFEEDGDHIPRLLPCTHTLCHTCIGQLIQGNRIECPECRMKHEAKNEEKSFPQNKYLLTQIKRKSLNTQPTVPEFQKCKEHGKELNLFCRTSGCNKPICRICLRKQHKEHDIIDIEEQEKEVLMKQLKEIQFNLGAKLNILSVTKNDIQEKGNVAIEEVKKKKEEIVKVCDKMIKEVEDQNKLDEMHIDNEIRAINSNIELLRCLDQNIDAEEEMNYEEIKNNQETVKGIIENNKTNFSGERSFGYPIFSAGKTSAQDLMGNISREEIAVSLNVTDNSHLEERKREPAKRKVKDASQLKCTVTKISDVNITGFYSMAPSNHHTAVVCGKEGGITKAKSYNLQTGTNISDVNIKGAHGITEVKLGGKLALAVSYHDTQKIEFRDAADLTHILLTHSVAPHKPGKLYTAAPSIIIYEDKSKKNCEVHWLDLSGSKPKPAAGKRVIHTETKGFYDMCLVQDGDKQLLIVAPYGAVFAYNTNTDRLEWKVSCRCSGMEKDISPFGITTDGRHLFVCDFLYGNNCIQMFSASDGQYLGCLVKGEEILGTPIAIYWCEATSSLVLCGLRNGYHLKRVKVHY